MYWWLIPVVWLAAGVVFAWGWSVYRKLQKEVAESSHEKLARMYRDSARGYFRESIFCKERGDKKGEREALAAASECLQNARRHERAREQGDENTSKP